VVDDLSHEGLRVLLREEGMSFQHLKTWKQSHDPAFEAKKNRILHLYGLMDATADVQPGDPDVVICVDEFGPLNLQPRPALDTSGRRRVEPASAAPGDLHRPHGVRHLLAAYDLNRDRLYGHIKPRKRRGEFLVFLRYLRILYRSTIASGIASVQAPTNQARELVASLRRHPSARVREAAHAIPSLTD
jgi:hypothetical protein